MNEGLISGVFLVMPWLGLTGIWNAIDSNPPSVLGHANFATALRWLGDLRLALDNKTGTRSNLNFGVRMYTKAVNPREIVKSIDSCYL